MYTPTTDADGLRKIISGEAQGAEAKEIMEEAFTPLVKWDDPSVVQDYLTYAYGLDHKEIETLYDKGHCPVIDTVAKKEPIPSDPPKPQWKPGSKRVKEHAKELWKARQHLQEAKKCISETALFPVDYKTEEDFHTALSERLNVNRDFVNLNFFIDAHLDWANRFIAENERQ